MSAWSGGQEHRLRYVGSLICSKALRVGVCVGVGAGAVRIGTL